MAYVYLALATFFSALLSIMGALFNKKNHAYKNFSMLYNFLLISCASIGWGILYATDFSFDVRVLPYSIGYSIGYAMALIGLFKALECGPVSLTSLLKSLSMITVSVWGFFFWDTPLTVYVAIGLSLVVISLLFCFIQRKGDKEKRISLRWFIFTLILFVGNGGSLVVQKYQQIAFGGAHKNMLMFFATAIAAIICLVFYLSGRKKTVFPLKALKKTWWIPAVTGFGSTLLNLFILLMNDQNLSPSVIYPVMAVGAIIITTLFSVLAYKERLRRAQWIGLFVGMLALVFLNL